MELSRMVVRVRACACLSRVLALCTAWFALVPLARADRTAKRWRVGLCLRLRLRCAAADKTATLCSTTLGSLGPLGSSTSLCSFSGLSTRRFRTNG